MQNRHLLGSEAPMDALVKVLLQCLALGIRYKSQMTVSLDRSGQRSLIRCADPGNPSGKNFAALRSILVKPYFQSFLYSIDQQIFRYDDCT